MFVYEIFNIVVYEDSCQNILIVSHFGRNFWCSWRVITSYAIETRFVNVTGPPGALLFDRDQRSHWNNHYNCCFVRVATLGIYCIDFLPQLLAQVKYPMQFGWASYLTVVINTLNSKVTALSEETSLHWATMHWTTTIRNNEMLWLWLGMTHVITSQRKINNWTRNMRFNLECSEHLVFKPFLITMIQNIVPINAVEGT